MLRALCRQRLQAGQRLGLGLGWVLWAASALRGSSSQRDFRFHPVVSETVTCTWQMCRPKEPIARALKPLSRWASQQPLRKEQGWPVAQPSRVAKREETFWEGTGSRQAAGEEISRVEPGGASVEQASWQSARK